MAKRFTDADLARFRNKNGENIPVPKERKAPSNEESQIQKALIKWWAVACRGHGIPEFLLFAIPNGGKRDVVTATNLKREGARSGTSDLFLSVPTARYHGLYIEMKRPGGAASEAQMQFLAEVSNRGYAAFLCYTLQQGIEYIREYLAGKEFY